ncbi:MAG: type II toxin-antitoxin system VapC family toxin [Proteobacteria bacterium]|nr:type II toxin-antitoxin system VapC family toxin [Pseudomonadota bacterium]
MIVVDTNVISYLMVPNEAYNQSAIRLCEKDSNWIAPSLWRYEFLSVLLLYRRKSIINSSKCKILYKKALEIVETRNFVDIDRVFEVMENSTLSVYDCSFVALADETNLPLITEDKKILSEFPTIAFSIETYL